MPLPGLDLSSGARVGLTGFLAGVARTVAHANVTINFLLPGSFDTPRMQSIQEAAARQQGIAGERHRRARPRRAIPANRFGDTRRVRRGVRVPLRGEPGFITGQSLLIDGGAYPGIL